MRIDNEPKLDFADVLIRPKRSTLKSRQDVDITRTFTFRNSNTQWKGVPIISANMDHTGTIEMASVFQKHQMMVALHKFYSEEDYLNLKMPSNRYFYSTGITSSDYEKMTSVLNKKHDINYVCIDVANGYSEYFVDFVKKVRNDHPTKTIMAGNVVTGEMTEELILAGADIVKIGIGPGSVCTTRKMTGVGYPQLSAIIECADSAHGLGGHICADGGCQVPGDLVKAFGAGADFIMIGGMFAGHIECSGDVYTKDGSQYKRFYGMSSKEAQENHGSSLKDYRASEGREIDVPFKGNVDHTIQEILGGLRSGMTYVGARQLKELSKRTTFIMVNRQLNTKFEK